MAISANLGFPRIGVKRELKHAIEQYWTGIISEQELKRTAAELRQKHWKLQRDHGILHIPSNDFSLYDHVLDTAVMVGAVPPRYGWQGETVSLSTYFAMARGTSDVTAMELTKWFDTNYHYIVPEFHAGQTFCLASAKPIDEFKEALALGILTRPVILGPVSFLMLGKSVDGPFSLGQSLSRILPVYESVISLLAGAGAEWIQIDEPVLTLDLSQEVMDAFPDVYARLHRAAASARICLATYFNSLGDALSMVCRLPVQALHVDLVRAPEQIDQLLHSVPETMCLSLGIIDGRNIWRTDLDIALAMLERAKDILPGRQIMVAPSCSLIHCPVDLAEENKMDDETKGWLAFATQKLDEISVLTKALNDGHEAVKEALLESSRRVQSRRQSPRIHQPAIQSRVASVDDSMLRRKSAYSARRELQYSFLRLPALPTTTIGSFPQTAEVRTMRAAARKREITGEQYRVFLKKTISEAIRFQEEIGLDVLVHGETERNDMVEYFGEQLNGFMSTQNGWVQSYGTRCVKPPIIFGDVSRSSAMTVDWISYAQSLTNKPVKGMLTGPVTILQWSFVRDDKPRQDIAFQLALALRDEVEDLEAAGIKVIQIDEPALREGLPLRRKQWPAYLEWAVNAFKLVSSGVRDDTQIHTHMCYSNFNDIIDSIAALDADVISIEASRSNMELLQVFAQFQYPNEIGPGVYDIHSPRVPSVEEISSHLHNALAVLNSGQIWVNPDCGLKTRGWPEVRKSLKNMVAAARSVRSALLK
ncbi:MAG TPA: 5-methyltetrahydropteroyltriglutamate--homocysteine S-methyltransferase [Desulfotomaculum sp.]|nr:5-methyltetrahydropteroyltriglutamate--homocysteine S-methyltransferase [Desulfotomaculum sp.]